MGKSQIRQSYHGYYTASEYAIVKGELLKKYKEEFNVTTLDAICRYVAKHHWPKLRREVYLAATQAAVSFRSAQAAVRMLIVYDEAQNLFDRFHYGDDYRREYEPIPGIVPESFQRN